MPHDARRIPKESTVFDEHGTDISALYERESISISDYVTSLKHDTRLMRKSKGTPQDVNIYGYVYNIDTNELSLVVEDKGNRR